MAINLNVRYVKESDIDKPKMQFPKKSNDQNRAIKLFKMGVTSIIIDTLIEEEGRKWQELKR